MPPRPPALPVSNKALGPLRCLCRTRHSAWRGHGALSCNRRLCCFERWSTTTVQLSFERPSFAMFRMAASVPSGMRRLRVASLALHSAVPDAPDGSPRALDSRRRPAGPWPRNPAPPSVAPLVVRDIACSDALGRSLKQRPWCRIFCRARAIGRSLRGEKHADRTETRQRCVHCRADHGSTRGLVCPFEKRAHLCGCRSLVPFALDRASLVT
jgi:hypothetical protein